jgi:hypothetical protein
MKRLMLALFVAMLILFFITFRHSVLPEMVSEAFDTQRQTNTAPSVTDGSIAPLCPPGFKFFTDREGNSLCCSGRIDYTEGRCHSISGISDKAKVPFVCSLGGDTIDGFGTPIRFCGSMMQELLSELGARDCTRDKPFRATSNGVDGVCCSDKPSSAMPHKCPFQSRSCGIVPEDTTPFYSPGSCRIEKMMDTLKCPKEMTGMTMVMQQGQVAGMSVPVCWTTKMPLAGPPMCISRPILDELRRFGVYRDKDLRKWIGNCEVFTKVNISKTETKERVDISDF